MATAYCVHKLQLLPTAIGTWSWFMCHMFQHVIGNKITETHSSVITASGLEGLCMTQCKIGIPGNTVWEVGCDLHKWQWSWKDKVLLSLHLYRKLWFHLVFSIWRDFGLPNLYIKIFLAMDEKQQKKVGVQTCDFSVLSPPTVPCLTAEKHWQFIGISCSYTLT